MRCLSYFERLNKDTFALSHATPVWVFVHGTTSSPLLAEVDQSIGQPAPRPIHPSVTSNSEIGIRHRSGLKGRSLASWWPSVAYFDAMHEASLRVCDFSLIAICDLCHLCDLLAPGFRFIFCFLKYQSFEPVMAQDPVQLSSILAIQHLLILKFPFSTQRHPEKFSLSFSRIWKDHLSSRTQSNIYMGFRSAPNPWWRHP